ncbi:MAG: MFS transporter [Streptosporangiaceae bacterium]
MRTRRACCWAQAAATTALLAGMCLSLGGFMLAGHNRVLYAVSAAFLGVSYGLVYPLIQARAAGSTPGDLAGRRNVFLAGLGVFTGASLLCGLAASQETLIAARFLQGAGGALTSAVILGMIVTMFADPPDQARAIGVFAFVASAGAAVGLLAGGILTQLLNWHWIFFVNLPIGAVTAIATLRVIRPDRGAGLRAGADVPGALLITGAPAVLPGIRCNRDAKGIRMGKLVAAQVIHVIHAAQSRPHRLPGARAPG